MVRSGSTSGIARMVGEVLLTLTSSLPTDNTKDLYNHGAGLSHCEFRFRVINGTVMNIQHNQFNDFQEDFRAVNKSGERHNSHYDQIYLIDSQGVQEIKFLGVKSFRNGDTRIK